MMIANIYSRRIEQTTFSTLILADSKGEQSEVFFIADGLHILKGLSNMAVMGHI